MNTLEDKIIPRLPANKFLRENWDASANLLHCDFTDADIQKKKIIGWCPASRVFFHPRDDFDCIAIMMSNGKWHHFPFYSIVDYHINPMWDLFNYFKFEGLDRKVIDDWAQVQRSRWI